MAENPGRGEQESGDTFSAIDVAVLMEQVRLEVPQGTVTVQGTIEALRRSSKASNVIYGDLRGFDQSMMSFRCPAASGFGIEEHVVLRGTLKCKRSTIHRGYDLELIGDRIGHWTANEPSSSDQPVLERAEAKVSLERFLSKGDAKRLVLLGTKTGINDAKSALSRWPGVSPDQRIVATTPEGILSAIAEASTRYDGLCLLRGGGDASSFATWNDRRVVAVLNRSGKPFYTALGHASDVTLADKHADESFATPTSLGAALAEAWQARDEREQLMRRVQNLNRINRELKAANESANGEALGQKSISLQTVLNEVQNLSGAIAGQTGQLTATIHKRMRFHTCTWLFSVFLLGVMAGGTCFYLLERSLVAGAQQQTQGSQPRHQPGTTPSDVKAAQGHRSR